ncbi:class I SAM-dependent methyltransferase [Brevibacillus migulae]|uniref:class I SAM-dependent methyltransferase n=1 Tax=Brevibacillus migulae TaxID=1644114 RepID=UPI00106E212B|nr:class I SAM-dependent methyltransferase [Brevibacillus migulae]
MSNHFFFKIHRDLLREGPGNNESTRRAYRMLSEVPKHPHILDVGCGPGAQTIELAKLSAGTITAVDTHEPFLDELNRRAQTAGVSEQVTAQKASMFSLPFAAGSFDLIWSEGAIYIMGFEHGLRTWRPLLKPHGSIVVSELTWLRAAPPVEIAEFWTENYPGMQDVDGNLALIEQAGFEVVGHFILPEAGWWEYYQPLEERIAVLREQYKDNEEKLAHLAVAQQEIDLYRLYSAYYGYVFYVMQAK